MSTIIGTIIATEVVEIRPTVLEDTVLLRSWRLQPGDGEIEHVMLADMRLGIEDAAELIRELQLAVGKLRLRAARDPRPVRDRQTTRLD